MWKDLLLEFLFFCFLGVGIGNIVYNIVDHLHINSKTLKFIVYMSTSMSFIGVFMIFLEAYRLLLELAK